MIRQWFSRVMILTLLWGAFLPSLSVQGKGLPSLYVQPPDGWVPVLSDSFEDNGNQWYVGDENYSGQTGNFSISQGEYLWSFQSLDGYAGYFQVPTMPVLMDFYLSVKLTQLDGAENGHAGVKFRIDENWNNYTFSICAQCQQYAVYLNQEGVDTVMLADWIDSDLINPSSSNILEIQAEGSKFEFSINGQLVETITDATIQQGITGLSAAIYETNDSLDYSFDDFKVWQPQEKSRQETGGFQSTIDPPTGWVKVLEDPMQDNRFDWFTGTDSGSDWNADYEIQNGTYQWQFDAKDGGDWWSWSSSTPMMTDFFASVDIVLLDPGYSMAGINFRMDADGNNFYSFQMDDSGYTVDRYQDGTWFPLIGWQSSGVVNANGPNQMAVLAQGGHFTFYINGQAVANIEDEFLANGRVGLNCGIYLNNEERINFDFDNFILYQPSTPPLPKVDVPDWPLTLTDDFHDNQNNWPEGALESIYSYGDTQIVNGHYQVDITARESFSHTLVPKIGGISNFYFKMDMLHSTEFDDASMGLILRLDDRWSSFRNSYQFLISDRSGMFTIGHSLNGEFITDIPWTYSQWIKPGEVNNLAVLAEDSRLSFFINDQKVGALNNDEILLGSIGIVTEIYEARLRAQFLFDNLELRLPEGFDALLFDGYRMLNTGDEPGAKKIFAQILQLTISEKNMGKQMALLNYLSKVYEDGNQFDPAQDYLLQAIQIAETRGDPKAIGDMYESLAAISAAKGDFRAEGAAYEKAAAIWQRIGFDWKYAEALHRIGMSYFELSEYERAMKYTQQALDLREQWTGLNDRLDVSRGYNNLANLYSLMGEFDTALEYYQKAYAITGEINDLSIRPALYLSNIGDLYATQEKYESALEYELQAYQIFADIEKDSHPRYDYYASSNMVIIGETFVQLGDLAQAFSYLDEARTIVDTMNEPQVTANLSMTYGLAYKEQGNDEKALLYYEQALATYKNLGDQYGISVALDAIGQIQEKMGDDEKALGSYLDSIAAFESVLAGYKTEVFRSELSSTSNEIYQHAVRLLVSTGQYEEAFRFTERNRARGFLEAMGNKRPDVLSIADENYLLKEELLRSQISSLEILLTDAKNRPKSEWDHTNIDDLDMELTRQQKKYQELLTQIELNGTGLTSLVAIPEIGTTQVQQFMDKNSTLVSYYFTDQNVFAFVISRDDYHVVELPASPEKIKKAVEDFRNLGMSNLNNAHPHSLMDLYDWLILPVRPFITTKAVGIVPHQSLHYLPFAALTDGNIFFGEEYVLYDLPSLSVLPFIQQNSDNTQTSALVMGDPSTDDPSLSPLSFAAEEAHFVAAQFGVQPKLQDQASEEILITNIGSAGVLHLAVHGSLNPHAPLFSRLWLTPSASQDGRLNVYEIYNLDLGKTGLVVLSACQTQVGDLNNGDEIVGLNRAFLYQTPTVIGTLWSVDDEASSRLMEYFYKNLLKGNSKAQALALAQEMLRMDPEHPQWEHPYYWAAYVLNGDPGTELMDGARNRADQTVAMMIFVTIFVLAGFVFLQIKKHRKHF